VLGGKNCVLVNFKMVRQGKKVGDFGSGNSWDKFYVGVFSDIFAIWWW
jgi:hypothetical protein